MKNSHLLFIVCLLITLKTTAQTTFKVGEKCGMNEVQSAWETKRPQAIQELKDFQQVIQQYSTKRTSGRASTLTIPVVVHVICLSSEAVGTGRNLTDARVQAQIAILNRDYMALNPNYTSGTPTVFQSARGIPEIQFCLASIDPNGNATTGIVRHNYTDPATTNDIENTIKPATSWDATKYLNIWSLAIPGTNSTGGTIGYAYLPTTGMVGSNIDGVVIDYRWFGSPTFSGVSGDCRSVSHEVGHFLGLQHTWGPTTSNHVCTDDDGIADTPLQQGPTADNLSFQCASGVPPTTCSGVQSMYCDYMDYADNDACYSMFTAGQVNVMRNVTLGTPITVNGNAYDGRSSLLTAQNTVCAPSLLYDAGITAHITPANLGSQCGTAAITPQVTLKNYGVNTLTSDTIRYQINGGAVTNYRWTGSLASNATTNVTLPAFTPPAGTFTFKSFSSKPNGNTDQNTLNDTFSTTYTATGIIALPFSENFSATNFNPTVSGIKVVQNPTDAWTWTRSTLSAYGTGTGSAIMDNYASTGTATANPVGTTDDLVSPTFSFVGVSNATLTFDVAYAPYNDGTNIFYDSLAVLVSTDCGQTYNQRIFYSGGTSLATAPGLATAFAPTNTQWVNKSVNLSSLNGLNNVTFAFRNISDWANQMYLDNINIASTVCNLSSTTSGTATTCGLSNGTATVTPSGGANYTYLWSNGGAGATISNLAAATYTVTVSAGGCSTTASRVVNSSAGITATTSGTATTCGLSNGTATVTPTGGTNYTYLWSNGGAGATISNLPATTYTVTVTSGSCTTTATRAVGTSTAVTATTSGNATSCGLSNGTATVTPSGGTTYTYLWSNGGAGATISNLPATTYTVTVTSGSCTTTATRAVGTSTAVTATTSGNATTCGLSNGTATVTPSGGTTYTYLWSNGGAGATISNLPAATYTVTVTSGSCTTTATRAVGTSAGISATASGTAATTCGTANGSASVTPTGGTNYTYNWNNGGSSASISNLTPALYTVTVTSNGCSTTASFNVTAPNSISATASGSATTCGLSNGTASVTPTGGTTYTYNWSNGGGGAAISSLASGTYKVTVTSNGCSTTASYLVNASTGVTATTSGTATTCGGSNGSASVTPTGGTTYTYNWSNGGAGAAISSLASGTYKVTVTSNGCSTTASYLVNTSTGITANISGSATSCGGNNGTASVAPTGGTTYTYLWSTTEGSASIANLSAAPYSVTISSNGCTTTASYTVATSSALAATISSTPVTTTPNNGTATAAPSNGTSPYTYAWSNGQTQAKATNLAAGSYSVTITDKVNCTVVKTIEVGSTLGVVDVSDKAKFAIYPNPMERELNVEVTCTTCEDILIEIMSINGQSVYKQFLETDITKKAVINTENLAPGLYCVRITTGSGQVISKVIKQ